MEEGAGTSHGVHAAASSSTSSTPMSSQAAPLPKVTPAKKGAPRPLRVPKAKSVATGDHQSSAIPTPRVQHSKASPPTQMPNIEEDIFGSWDEIEREERQVRIELNAAKPGDPILGPIELLPDEEFPELPFRVFTTRYGEVYHLDRNNQHWDCQGIKMVQQMPAFVLSNWHNTGERRSSLSERVWKRRPHQHELSCRFGCESLSSLHGMHRTAKPKQLELIGTDRK